MRSEADVVIVGGGVIGCSVAYHLTEWEDANIILLEKLDIGERETRVSAAMVMLQTQDELLTNFAKVSIQEYTDLTRYVGQNAGFRKTGSILYSTNEDGADEIRRMAHDQEKLHVPTELLTGLEIRKYAPNIRVDDIIAASYCPLDGYVDQKRLVDAYARYSRQHGVDIRPRTEAIGIDVEDGCVRGVQTNKGYIRTPLVVNAAGAAARRVGRLVGVEIPIRINKRDIVILSKEPYQGPIVEDITTGWYIRPYNGYTLAGVGPVRALSYLPDDSEMETESDIVKTVDKFLAQRIPSFAGSTIDSKWGGIRSLTPDGLPILGPLRNLKGFLNCCALSGFGITNAPAVGKIITEIVREGRSKSFDLEPFSFDRFPAEWRIKNDRLMIGGEEVLHVAKRFATPLYLYDTSIILDRLKRVKQALPGFEIWYSAKSNPNPLVMQVFADFGEAVTITSPAELKQALRAGFPSDRIAFGGPGKGHEELEYILRAGVLTIDVESRRELLILDELAARIGIKARISLRVNTNVKASMAGEYMGGIPTKFGFDEENILHDLNGLDLRHVAIEGIHGHLASQVLDSKFFLRHYTRLAQISKQLASDLPFDLKYINFGGGLGVQYSVHDNPINLVKLGPLLTKALSDEFPEDGIKRPRYQLEFGRYLVADSGLFLTEVVDVKHSRGKTFVITDSGISGFSRPAMPWAQQHLCSIVTKEDVRPTGVYTIVGPSCLPADVLCEQTELPDPTPGDILALHGAGAYGYTMSMLYWSGIKTPREICFHANEFEIARERLENDGIGKG